MRRTKTSLEPRGRPDTTVVLAAPVGRSSQEARRCWAALVRRIYEVDPMRGPRCGAAMRIIACITDRAVIDRILAHRRTRAAARARPARSRPVPTAAPQP